MHTISVGQPYNPNRPRWPEGAQYNYRAGAHELLLFLGSPTKDEVKAVRQGLARFALHTHEPLLVLLWSFAPTLPWSDAPYSWHLVPEAERDLPSADLNANTCVMLRTILVDADTGIVRAIRALSLTPTFTRALHAAIREQAARAWNEAEYDSELRRLYDRATAADLARSSAVRFP